MNFVFFGFIVWLLKRQIVDNVIEIKKKQILATQPSLLKSLQSLENVYFLKHDTKQTSTKIHKKCEGKKQISYVREEME